MLRKLLVIALFVTTGATFAQAPAPSKQFEPNEMERLRLQVAQKDAQLAQVQLQAAQRTFQSALALLDERAGEVKKAHPDWPKEVQFSPDTLVFMLPPPAAPAEKKP